MASPFGSWPNFNEDGSEINRRAETVLIGSNIGLALANSYLGATKSGKAIPASLGIALGASTVTLGLTDHANYSTADIITSGLSAAAGSWALYTLLGGQEPVENLRVAPITGARFENNIGISLNYQF